MPGFREFRGLDLYRQRGPGFGRGKDPFLDIEKGVDHSRIELTSCPFFHV
jgi:hypothetical protein